MFIHPFSFPLFVCFFVHSCHRSCILSTCVQEKKQKNKKVQWKTKWPYMFCFFFCFLHYYYYYYYNYYFKDPAQTVLMHMHSLIWNFGGHVFSWTPSLNSCKSFYTPPHIYIMGYHGFTLDVRMSIHPSICLSVVSPSVHISFPDDNLSKHQWIFTKLGICIDIVEIWFGIANGQFSSNFDGWWLEFHFRVMTWVNINVFSPNLVCALIFKRSGLGLLMGKFCQIFRELSARDTPIFLFLDNNLSKCQGILTELGTCLMWRRSGWDCYGQILSTFDRVICLRNTIMAGYYSLTFLFLL